MHATSSTHHHRLINWKVSLVMNKMPTLASGEITSLQDTAMGPTHTSSCAQLKHISITRSAMNTWLMVHMLMFC